MAAGTDAGGAGVPWAVVTTAAAVALLVFGIGAFLVLTNGDDEDASTAEVTYDDDTAVPVDAPAPGPTAGILVPAPSVGAPLAAAGGLGVLADLELGDGVLALRADKTVELVDLATGAIVATIDADRSSGGDLWFQGRSIVMRTQGQNGPSMAVLDVDSARYRLYGGFNFIPSAVSAQLIVGQEFGEFLGGGHWATVELETFAIDRVDLAVAGAFPFPVAVDAGLVANEGGQVVLYAESGPRVLAAGELLAWSSDAVLVGSCSPTLDCTAATVAVDGTVLASGPQVDLPDLSLGGETRWLAPGGKTLAQIVPNTRELLLVDIASGTFIDHELGRTSAQSLVWSHDGSAVVLADREQVVVVDVTDGTVVAIEAGGRVDQVGLLSPASPAVG